MYKLISKGGVFHLIEKESGKIIKVGNFEECYAVVEEWINLQSKYSS